MQSQNQKRENSIEHRESTIAMLERAKKGINKSKRGDEIKAKEIEVIDCRIAMHQMVIKNTEVNIKYNKTAKQRRKSRFVQDDRPHSGIHQVGGFNFDEFPFGKGMR